MLWFLIWIYEKEDYLGNIEVMLFVSFLFFSYRVIVVIMKLLLSIWDLKIINWFVWVSVKCLKNKVVFVIMLFDDIDGLVVYLFKFVRRGCY